MLLPNTHDIYHQQLANYREQDHTIFETIATVLSLPRHFTITEDTGTPGPTTEFKSTAALNIPGAIQTTLPLPVVIRHTCFH